MSSYLNKGMRVDNKLSERLVARDTTNAPEPANSAETVADHTAVPQRWPRILCMCICTYYAMSALTLPFVNRLWFGEISPLAIFQFPKSFLKSIIQKILLSMFHFFGLSRGSASPDYAATHGWAMIATVTLPALFVIAVCSLMRSPAHRRLLAAILICAALDAVVTLWFDSASNLKLYDAIFF